VDTTLVAGIPGVIALIVCIRYGYERAFLAVYLPTLLLLPDSYRWTITGHLNFNETAIIPIAAFLIARSWTEWEWSFTDLLILSYLALTVVSEYVNKDFYEARNAAINNICSMVLPYILAKGALRRESLYSDFAKRVVECLAVAAIIGLYEFRMGRNPYEAVLSRFFPGQSSAIWVGRYGFLRIAGPYGHAIIAGVMLATGYRLVRWLEWSGEWRGRFRFIPLSKPRVIRLLLIGASVMTLSRGPWLGAIVAAAIVTLGRARNRRSAIIVSACALLFLGLPLWQASKSYVWVERSQAADEMEETAAYRHELIERYIVIVQERPSLGWGRNAFPIVNGMSSVDNNYLLLALTHGEYALAVFVAILVWIPARLLSFCARRSRDDPAGLIGLTSLGCFVTIAVSISTVAMMWQLIPIFFLLAGSSEGLLLGWDRDEAREVTAEPVFGFALRFRRVMI
jgi:O-antigen ligase/polysaccharide polymerase Wzy-like membrane protein